jgi:hypothetical protein
MTQVEFRSHFSGGKKSMSYEPGNTVILILDVSPNDVSSHMTL